MDFVRGLTTICGAGSAGKKDGFAIHVYTASISMHNSCLANADGDMLIVPQQGILPFTLHQIFGCSLADNPRHILQNPNFISSFLAPSSYESCRTCSCYPLQAKYDMSCAKFSARLGIVPTAGTLRVTTEFGLMDVIPGEICVVQRGMRFSVGLQDSSAARGYVLEVFSGHFELPDLGPIGQPARLSNHT